ncbi:MAG: UDP-N-acetylmuramoyl-L-alanyl-D-glutamate--2,6-diaminopimelate ligase [Culicoidibacterales bacterium]
MKLQILFPKQNFHGINPNVESVTFDSRQVRPGTLFIAVKGFTVDGHDYIEMAVERGAVAIVAQQPIETSVPVIYVADTKVAMAEIANRFYGEPMKQLQLVGITGTDGKTSTATIIEHILNSCAQPSGYIGTNGVRYAGIAEPLHHTTPESLDLQAIFARMVAQATKVCAMEVSSHALELNRVRGVEFDVAVFTNLSHEHLDYHKTIENYLAAKAKLFSQLKSSGVAIINADDALSFAPLKAQIMHPTVTYGIEHEADFQATAIEETIKGTKFDVIVEGKTYPVAMKLLGRFNIYNALAALATATAQGIQLEAAITALEQLASIDGRMEVIDCGQDFGVIVDFAHTPNAIENLLTFVRPLTTNRLLLAVGSAGARDTEKRPIIAEIATRLADYTVLTMDDPYHEDPSDIIDEMITGVVNNNYQKIVARDEAMAHLLAMAQPGDVVIVAGRGNEDDLPIGNERIKLNDMTYCREWLETHKK